MLALGCDTSSRSSQNIPSVVEIQSSLEIPMVLLPGGEFTMGSSQNESDEGPPHQIILTPFAIDKYEFTQDLLARLQEPDPSHFKDPRRPVEQIRWSEAAILCNIRSEAEGLEPCYDESTFACNFDANGYRLPTEAEWEYAARAGDARDLPSGPAPKIDSKACYAGNSTQQTDPVGMRRANEFQLHDMLGNVAEWCHDIYGADYYQTAPSNDPQGPDSGKKRVIRGGSWKSSGAACRPSARASDNPGIDDACFTRDTLGFRCVRPLNAEERQQIGLPTIN